MDRNLPMEVLVLLTITPVQRFIEQARKTEDLWMGSYILSHLSATAIDQLHSEGIEIIFPAVGDLSATEFWREHGITIPAFPNRLLAYSSDRSLDELGQIMQQAEGAVQAEFQTIAAYCLDTVFGQGKWQDTYIDALYHKQTRHFLEIFWVVSPRFGDDYPAWYRRTERLLAATKNCRAFGQVTERGRKCSLDGVREIIHWTEGERARDAMRWWDSIAESHPKYCQRSEALSTISLIKRVGGAYFEDRAQDFAQLAFPSTSEVSTASFKVQLPTNIEALSLYCDFVKLVAQLKRKDGKPIYVPRIKTLPAISLPGITNIDGDWLFEESFSTDMLQRYHRVDVSRQDNRRQITVCATKLSALIEAVGSKPGRYYAVIVLDGDDMGKTLSKMVDKEQHREISERLGGYTKTVREIVERKYLGKLIYAGGDEALALVSLRDLLSVLRELREGFPNLLRDEDSTVSAGVCIAHNKLPLRDVLHWARQVEHAAKQEPRKNALGLVLLKHSGNISQTVVKWKYSSGGQELDTLRVSKDIIILLSDRDSAAGEDAHSGELSKKFLYAFRETFMKMLSLEGNLEVPRTLVATELRRLISRASGEQTKPTQLEDLVSMLNCVKPFACFLAYLEILSFMAREGQ